MIIPNIWGDKNVPNHQPDMILCIFPYLHFPSDSDLIIHDLWHALSFRQNRMMRLKQCDSVLGLLGNLEQVRRVRRDSLVGGLNPSEKYESQLGWLATQY